MTMPVMMNMADGNGQRVGSIVWFGNAGQIQKDANHVLNLLLFGASIPDGRAFHLQR